MRKPLKIEIKIRLQRALNGLKKLEEAPAATPELSPNPCPARPA